MKKYKDLHQLVREDTEAKLYFESLPSYVQEAMWERASGVNSVESLYDYADNLTRMDE